MLLGKFITLYGINGIGKTTQANLLVKYLNQHQKKAEYLKYPIYNLSPTGPIINEYLRQKNKFNLSSREIQIIFTLNRTQFQSELKDKLQQGINIIAEDYTRTGIVWGMANNVDQKFLKIINLHLIQEDMSILLDGTPFNNSLNQKHLYEKNNSLIKRARTIFIQFAKDNQWPIISADQPIEKVHQQIIKSINL